MVRKSNAPSQSDLFLSKRLRFLFMQTVRSSGYDADVSPPRGQNPAKFVKCMENVSNDYFFACSTLRAASSCARFSSSTVG